MRLSHFSCRILFAFAVTIGLSSGLAEQEASPSQNEFVPRFVTLRPTPPVNAEQAEADRVSGDTLPTWHGWFSHESVNYPFTMLGNKIVPGAGTTTIDVILVPLRVSFADGTVLDATQNACGWSRSPLTLTKRSPLFRRFTWTPGGTNVGHTQYADAFQRANFWNKVKQAPYSQYHTILRIAEVKPVQDIRVPAEEGSASTGPCASIGRVDFRYFDLQINAMLKSLDLPLNVLPIFLNYNVFGVSNGCCIIGYHGVRGASQVYGVAAYTDPGIFSEAGIQDIHGLSHEIGEIYDNPYASNNAPRWQSQYAPQYGCNYYLEVADPLVGAVLEVTMDGFTYHPQELVFKSWFAKAAQSNAVNGWYSFNQTLLSPSPVCQ